MFFDYISLEIDWNMEQLFSGYNEIILIGWSMGVWAGQKIFARGKKLFSRAIAINGTLCPVDDTMGIPVKVFDDTLSGFDRTARKKFYHRMCRERTDLRKFLANRPERSLESQRMELAALKKTTDCSSADRSVYSEIIIAENDFIVPSANQLYFWRNREVRTIPGFHFPFYKWQSWDQLLLFS